MKLKSLISVVEVLSLPIEVEVGSSSLSPHDSGLSETYKPIPLHHAILIKLLARTMTLRSTFKALMVLYGAPSVVGQPWAARAYRLACRLRS